MTATGQMILVLGAVAASVLTGFCVVASKPKSAYIVPGDSFKFHGRPIHPASVAALVGSIGEEPFPTAGAVDLEKSRDTSSNLTAVSVRDGEVRADSLDSGWSGTGFVAYRHIGVTATGTHVLVVMVNGGGNGVFEDVLWVKLVRDSVWEDGKKRARTMLIRAGQLALGDRDDGDVRLKAGTLFVGKSRYRQKEMIIPIE